MSKLETHIGLILILAIYASVGFSFYAIAEVGAQTEILEIQVDDSLADILDKLGIDPANVELKHDYGIGIASDGIKLSPYTQTYYDKETKQYIASISEIPMCLMDGRMIDSSWDYIDGSYIAGINTFNCFVRGTNVWVRSNTNLTRTYHAQLFEDDLEIFPTSIYPTLINDPLNKNYGANTLEWDYGICKRWVRVIESRIMGMWVFEEIPTRTVRFKYNQSGDFLLHLGPFNISDDEELVTPEDFQSLIPRPDGLHIIGDTDVFYPDADPETNTVDGNVRRYVAAGEAFSTLRNGNGTHAFDTTDTNVFAYLSARNAGGVWNNLHRSIFLFDTSSIGAMSTVTKATLSLYVNAKSNTMIGMGVPTYAVTTSTPASDTSLAAGDYQTMVGGPAISNSIAYASINLNAYNTWTILGGGTLTAVIDTTGITKLGMQEATWDIPNSAPIWGASDSHYIQGYYAEKGAGFQPKLTVVYRILHGVLNINPTQLGRLRVLGTEYIPEETAVVYAQLLTEGGTPVNNGRLSYNLRNSNNISIRSGSLTYMSPTNGIYSGTFSCPVVTDNYVIDAWAGGTVPAHGITEIHVGELWDDVLDAIYSCPCEQVYGGECDCDTDSIIDWLEENVMLIALAIILTGFALTGYVINKGELTIIGGLCFAIFGGYAYATSDTGISPLGTAAILIGLVVMLAGATMWRNRNEQQLDDEIVYEEESSLSQTRNRLKKLRGEDSDERDEKRKQRRQYRRDAEDL